MKNLSFTLLTLLTFLFMSAFGGHQVSYSETENGTMQLDFAVEEISLSEINLNGVVYTKINTNCRLMLEREGWAELPFLTVALELAPDKNYDLVFTGGEFTDYSLDYPLIPSRGVIYRNQNQSEIPYQIDPASIVDRYYPDMDAKMELPYIVKDVRGTTVTVYPFRYNAEQNVLRVYHSMTVQLIENKEPAHNPLLKVTETPLREMIGVYQSTFINYDASRYDLTIADMGEILIYTTARDESALQPYIEWKQQKGHAVHTHVVATGTNVDALVQQEYDLNNNILYVLLVGDWADIKCAVSSSTPTDPVTGCVVGNDDYFDIAVGRFSGNSPADIAVQVNKIVNYEKYPDMGASWYTHALGVASNEGPGDDGEYDNVHIQNIYDNKLQPFTYQTHTPVFAPNANITMINNALAAGTSIINYCGHGSTTSWGTTGFSNTNVNNLSNGDKLPFIFSVACVNGSYHNATCFAEAWLRKDGGGAVGMMAATINQPWQPPMRGQDYFNDLIVGGYDYSLYPGQNGITTTEGRTTFGSIVFNGLVLMITEVPGDLWTAQTWILFGDPSLQIRTATPKVLTHTNSVMLVGTPYETTINADGLPFGGAMVALTQDGVTLTAVSDATGLVSIPNDFLPGDVEMVVTGFNTGTIVETIQCIPPTGPYVIYESYTLNDINGNNNAILEYFDANVLLDFAVKNVGVAQANNVQVTITTNSPYATITNGTAGFGNIPAGGSVTVNNAFAFDVAGNVPEGQPISFTVTAVGQEAWESAFTIVAYSALLQYQSFEIDDSNGNNNGILDPGETANLIVTIKNNGSADAFNVFGSLASLDPYVFVNTAQPQGMGDIAGLQSAQATFSVTAAPSIPAGYVADLQVNFNADYGFEGSAVFGVLFPDYCYGTANCSWGDGITGFILEDINNMNNGCSSSGGIAGYGDFTQMSAQLEPGETYQVTLRTGYSNQNVSIWIDLNNNKEFEAGERLLTDFNLASANTNYTTNITIPADAPAGEKRLRARGRWMNTAVDPCEDWSYGETEDYTVMIGEPIYLPPPENLEAQVTGNNVTISWAPPETELDMMGYNVYKDGVKIATMMTETTMNDNNLPEGSYWYAVTAVYQEGESGHCMPVQVTIGSFIGIIQGSVRDATTKLSIPNAWVSALNTDFGAVTYQTPFGSHYTISLPGGTYTLQCSATGYQSAMATNVQVVDDGTLSVNFYLYPQVFADQGRDVTGIVEFVDDQVVLYPNPATNEIYVNADGVCDIDIYGISGQLVFKGKSIPANNAINISSFDAGIYFVRIITESGTFNQKLVIK
jgi:hypothetical protein